MRRRFPHRATVIGAAVACAALLMTGADKPKKKPEVVPKVEETIGDITNIFGRDLKVEGVGLVVGLDNTGAEPAPSWQQKKLVDEMQKSGIEHPERFLKNTSVSLVVVRAVIPAGVTTTDKFDIDIELPPASATTSLAGGWLISTRLAQRAMTKEGEKDDRVIATAMGPIMIGNAAKPGDPKIGRVLGGGKVLVDTPYQLGIKENRRSGKTSQLIENVVKQRFHQTQKAGNNKGMVEAKTDALSRPQGSQDVPPQPGALPSGHHATSTMVDNPNLREQRLQQWGNDLLDPKKAGIAALKLEGIGPERRLLSLKKGARLTRRDRPLLRGGGSRLPQQRRRGRAAVLYDMTAKRKPEFRAFALRRRWPRPTRRPRCSNSGP